MTDVLIVKHNSHARESSLKVKHNTEFWLYLGGINLESFRLM